MVRAHREVQSDGGVALRGERCSFFYRRPRPGLVAMKIVGARLDTGELGSAPMDELAADVAHGAPLELFIDASEAAGAVVSIQEGWADWFARHRAQLTSVSMLVQGKYMHFTVEVVKFFSRTDDLIRVYLDAGEFAEALERAAVRPRTRRR
jgi:hypothetical protein